MGNFLRSANGFFLQRNFMGCGKVEFMNLVSSKDYCCMQPVHCSLMKRVDRIVLLHGPPGTGKTSLCKALTQKLYIRFSSRYPQSQLVKSMHIRCSANGSLRAESWYKVINATLQSFLWPPLHAGCKTFPENSRNGGGRKQSEEVVVNALLTQMDKLKPSPNVIILTTSNITTAIDIAFIDRADIKAYVGPPTLQACYEILRTCLLELKRIGILPNFHTWVSPLQSNCQKSYSYCF